MILRRIVTPGARVRRNLRVVVAPGARMRCNLRGVVAPGSAHVFFFATKKTVALGARMHRSLRGVVAPGARTRCYLQGIVVPGVRMCRLLTCPMAPRSSKDRIRGWLRAFFLLGGRAFCDLPILERGSVNI